jgi:signal transduction histidine kinase
MLTSLHQSGIILLVVLFYPLGFWFLSRSARPGRAERSQPRWIGTALVVAAAGLLVAQPVLLPWLSLPIPEPLGSFVHAAGLTAIAGALLLFAWLRLHLQRFHAKWGDGQGKNQLIDTGPYAGTRHPLFTTFLILAFGSLLVNPSVTTLLLCIYAFWSLSRAAKREEESLRKTLPGYADYMAHTARFLPRLRSLNQLLDIRSLDPDEARRGKLLNILLLGVMVLSILALMALAALDLSGLFPNDSAARSGLALGYGAGLSAFVGTVAILVINRYHSGRLASWLFLFMLTIVISFSDEPHQVIDGRSLISYAIPILMASVLLRPRDSFIMASLASLLLCVIGASIQVFPNVVGMATFFMIALVSWLSARGLQTALEDLRVINRELDQRVRDRTRELAEALGREHATAVRNRTILEAIGDGVLVTDRQKRIILANPAANRMALLPPDQDLQERSLFEMLRGVEPEAVGQIEERMSNGDANEHSIIRFEWNKRTVAANIAPVSLVLPDQSVVAGGHVMALRDMTREVQLDRMKTIFLGAVSHELRTPMAAIRGYVEVLTDLESASLSEAGRKYLDIIDTNIRRLLALANDLIDLSRIEVGEIALYREWTDVTSIVEGAADTVRREFEKRGLSLAVQIEPDLPPLYVDQHRVTQILLNLLTNAYKYTVAGGATVDVGRTDGMVRIVVADTGVGLTEEEKTRLFERFFRSGNEVVQKAGGTGLGLAITKSLIELHGGTITFESESGKGTTFAVSFPTAQTA